MRVGRVVEQWEEIGKSTGLKGEKLMNFILVGIAGSIYIRVEVMKNLTNQIFKDAGRDI